MTTKECLHRFCSDCIITALRSGNKECPTCRKKLVSKRSLRPDPNFDCLISKIYPSRDEYEAHQEKVLAKFNKSHSQQAIVNSITEGIKLQSQNRPQRTSKKGGDEPNNNSSSTGQQNGDSGARELMSSNSQGSSHGGDSTRQSSNPPSARSTPSPVPSNVSSSASKPKRPQSIMTSEKSEDSESNSEMDAQTEGADSYIDTEGDGNSESGGSDEIELVFKPHPTEMSGDNILMKALKDNTVRYIKTTANATGKFLCQIISQDNLNLFILFS